MTSIPRPGPRRNGCGSHRAPVPTVLIAIPGAEARRRWRQGLGLGYRIEEVTTRAALEQSISRFRPDVVALDVALLPVDGVSAVQRWSASSRIIVLAGSLDEREAVAALKAGAMGYCHRDGPPFRIRIAVQAAQRDVIWTECPVIPHLLQELNLVEHRRSTAPPASPGPRNGLTSRERQIADLIGCGARNKQIASRLDITEATVKAHLTSIFRKLAVSDRLSLGLLLAEQARTQAPTAPSPR